MNLSGIFPVNLLDVLMVGFSALGAYVGSRIGVVCAAFYILGGIAGSAAATRLYLTLGMRIPVGSHSPFFGYMIVFLVVGGVFAALGIYLSRVLEKYFLGLHDRFVGGMLGILLSFVLSVSILVSLLIQPAPDFKMRASKSIIVRPLIQFSGKYLMILPHPMVNQMGESIRNLQLKRSREFLKSSPKAAPLGR